VVLDEMLERYYFSLFSGYFMEKERADAFRGDYWPRFLRDNVIYVFKKPIVGLTSVWEKFRL
jgi:hypothetical protein